ncbi:hypothetical protein RhiirC2_782698 [Rhizophagus irregularis]|uniref:Uncharacterized protein n=1 Tax=Rhizophagus irregularis TaxID=588596 RepID=A0A2N1N2K5_9GLOM|nr:hypothetical protein RhiirC2_782698 [Rhizophagus irregularis]
MSTAIDGFKARRQELEDIIEIDYSSDNQDLHRNWPIVTASESKMNVDHSINKVTLSNTVTQSLNRNLIEKIITSHKPTDNNTLKVKDILVYNIPVFWMAENILQQLTLWGKPIDIQMKC